MVLIFILIIISTVVITLLIEQSKENKALKEQQETPSEKFLKECKFLIRPEGDNKSYLAITSDNKIKFSYPRMAGEVDIKDVLKIDLKFDVLHQKRKKRNTPLTLIEKYNDVEILRGIELRIFQMNNNKDYMLSYDANSYKDPIVSQIEKFKYLVEDIKGKIDSYDKNEKTTIE